VRLTRWKFGVVEEEVAVGGQDAADAGNVIAVGGGGVAVEIAPVIVAIAGENVNATGRALKSCSIQRLWLWLER